LDALKKKEFGRTDIFERTYIYIYTDAFRTDIRTHKGMTKMYLNL